MHSAGNSHTHVAQIKRGKADLRSVIIIHKQPNFVNIPHDIYTQQRFNFYPSLSVVSVSVCGCVVLPTEYQNMHFTSNIRTFWGSEDILSGPYIFQSLFEV